MSPVRRASDDAAHMEGRPRVTRGGWLGYARFAAAGTLLIGLATALTASCRPNWYRPQSIDFRTLQTDKAELAAIENTISAALNAGRPATINLDEAQVNRWLAARDDLLAGVIETPAGIERPCVRFTADGIDLAATVRAGGWPVVVSAGARPRIEGDEIVLDHAWARVGRLGVPLAWVLPQLDLGPDAEHIRRLRCPRDFVWTNGERPCQLVSVELGAGAVRVTLAPAATLRGGPPAEDHPP